MSAILSRLETRPPPTRRRPATTGKPMIRPARRAPRLDTVASLAPMLRAAVVLIGVGLLAVTLEHSVAELLDRVRVLLMPRI